MIKGLVAMVTVHDTGLKMPVCLNTLAGWYGLEVSQQVDLLFLWQIANDIINLIGYCGIHYVEANSDNTIHSWMSWGNNFSEQNGLNLKIRRLNGIYIHMS